MNPSSEVGVRVMLNDVEVKGSGHEVQITKSDSEVEITGPFIINASAGDEVTVQFTSNATTVSQQSHQNFGDEPTSGVLLMRQISNR